MLFNAWRHLARASGSHTLVPDSLSANALALNMFSASHQLARVSLSMHDLGVMTIKARLRRGIANTSAYPRQLTQFPARVLRPSPLTPATPPLHIPRMLVHGPCRALPRHRLSVSLAFFVPGVLILCLISDSFRRTTVFEAIPLPFFFRRDYLV